MNLKKFVLTCMIGLAVACGGKGLTGPTETAVAPETSGGTQVSASSYDTLLKQKSTFSVEENTVTWHAKNPTNDNVGPFFLLVFDRTLSPQKFLAAAGPFVLEGGTSKDFEVQFEGCGIPLQVDAYLGRELTEQMKNDQFSGGYLLDADWLDSSPCVKKIPPPECEVPSVQGRPNPCPSPSPSPSPSPECEDFKLPEIDVDFSILSSPTAGGVTTTGSNCASNYQGILNPSICLPSSTISPAAVGTFVPAGTSKEFTFSYNGTFNPTEGLTCPVTATAKATVTAPACVDEVTYTYKDETVTINGVTNSGLYYIKDNGNITNFLGTNIFWINAGQKITFHYAQNGHTLKLYDVQNDLQGNTTTVATCSDFNSSWHANMSYSCTKVEHHSCEQ